MSTKPFTTTPSGVVEFAVATIASLTQLGLTAVLTGLAVGISHETEVWPVNVAAAVLAYFVLAALLATMLLALRPAPATRSNALLWAPEAAMAALSFTASILAIYTLGWIRADPTHTLASYHSLAAGGIVLWVLTTLSHIVYQGLRFARRRVVSRTNSTVPTRPSRSPPRGVSQSLSLHLKSLSPGSRADSAVNVGTPTFSPYLASSTHSIRSVRSSARNSINHLIRPITSRTRLILGQNSSPIPPLPSRPHTRADSLEFGCRGDGFDAWDASATDLPSLVHPSRSALRLDPIPGSRPGSPAVVVNGPFRCLAPEDTPLPDSPVPDSGPPLLPPLRQDSSSAFPPSAGAAAAAAAAPGESHIHPLFRSVSSTPPPVALPSTVITASPYAGQVVSPDWDRLPRKLHSANASRSSSPARESSRAGSVRSSRRPSGLGREVSLDEERPAMPKLGG